MILRLLAGFLLLVSTAQAITETCATAATGTSANAIITHGLTIAANDVLVALVHGDTALASITDSNPSFPFTERIEAIGQSGSTNKYAIYDRVAGGSEPTSYDWDLSASVAWSVILCKYAGADTAAIWDVTPSASTDAEGVGVTATAISITINTANAWGLILNVTDSPTITFSAPTNGYTNEVEAGTQSSVKYSREWTATGATGTVAFTLSASNDWLVHHVALKPAGGALSPAGIINNPLAY